MEDGGRIEATARPDSNGAVSRQMLFDGTPQQAIQPFFRSGRGPLRVGKGIERPIPVDSGITARPFQIMTGGQLFNSTNQSARTGNVVERQEVFESLLVQDAWNGGMRENSLQFRPKIDLPCLASEIEWLDSRSISGEYEPFLVSIPKRDGEHAPESAEAVSAPLAESFEHNLRVATGAKARALTLQIVPEFKVIVDLTVEGNNGLTVHAAKRLRPGSRIDHGQSHCTERNIFRNERILFVRPTMEQRRRDPPDETHIERPAIVGKTRDSAH